MVNFRNLQESDCRKDFNVSSIKETKQCSIGREGLVKMLTELFPETSGA